ncbi:M10 family metallopeptidase C-terminal domain-containing protein [Paracoccus sp. (in: a-proteobacteria)]|uniref:M10 family metallopeptidase C-terminal domain-containing protein n=1 Tax=Paracoccus sp. TaxID=267 RepID=UPI003A8BB99A
MCIMCQTSPVNLLNGAHNLWVEQYLDQSGRVTATGSYQSLQYAALGTAALADGGPLLEDYVIDYGATPFRYLDGPTGNDLIDGTLSSLAWVSPNLTYSFPDSDADYGPNAAGTIEGLAEMNAAQKYWMRYWLDQAASVSGLTFRELDGPEGSLTADQEATLKFANMYFPVGGITTLPNPYPSGGDVFIGDFYAAPSLGNWDMFVLGHELGHALGLKHGHATTGSYMALQGNHDSAEYSIMTYNSTPGGGHTQSLYAHSFMIADIAGLQHMYGANFDYNSGHTVYSFSTETGEMSVNGVGTGHTNASILRDGTIFRTIWDGNGTDTYDFSNFGTNLAIDLTPGGYSDLDVGGATHKMILAYDAATRQFTYARGHVYNALQYKGDARSLIENANGGSGHDVIRGNQANNVLNGNAGNDQIFGGAGYDWLNGGDGNDQLFDSDGYGVFNGGAGIDWLNLSEMTSGITLYAATKIGVSAAGLFRYSEIEVITATNYGDLIYSWAGPTIYAAGGNDTIHGTGSDDRLFGENGNDFLNGGTGNDGLYGGNGDDTLVSGSGNDTLDGGTGSDWVDFAETTTGITVDLGAGRINDGRYVSSLRSIENIRGSETADYLLGDDGGNRIVGQNGRDRIEGRGGNDLIDGGASWDTLLGGTGNDTILGGGGNDVILQNLSWEVDSIDGGAGGDTLDYGQINEPSGYMAVSYGIYARLDLGYIVKAPYYGGIKDSVTGIEHINGTAITDHIYGDAIGNRLDGRAGNDLLDGGAGNDVLIGGEGNDTLRGGDGNDTFQQHLLWAYDTIEGGAGVDTIDYGALNAPAGYMAVSYGIYARLDLGYVSKAPYYDGIVDRINGIENINGTKINDLFYGDGAGNRFSGREGNDLMDGGAGNDTLIGDAGSDTLKGGAGSDLFIFRNSTGGDVDMVVDFEREIDRIDMWGLNYASGQRLTNPDTNGDGYVNAADAGWSYRNNTLTFDGDGIDVSFVGLSSLHSGSFSTFQ